MHNNYDAIMHVPWGTSDKAETVLPHIPPGIDVTETKIMDLKKGRKVSINSYTTCSQLDTIIVNATNTVTRCST